MSKFCSNEYAFVGKREGSGRSWAERCDVNLFMIIFLCVCVCSFVWFWFCCCFGFGFFCAVFDYKKEVLIQLFFAYTQQRGETCHACTLLLNIQSHCEDSILTFEGFNNLITRSI